MIVNTASGEAMLAVRPAPVIHFYSPTYKGVCAVIEHSRPSHLPRI
jgi:hypothetical protein